MDTSRGTKPKDPRYAAVSKMTYSTQQYRHGKKSVLNFFVFSPIAKFSAPSFSSTLSTIFNFVPRAFVGKILEGEEVGPLHEI